MARWTLLLLFTLLAPPLALAARHGASAGAPAPAPAAGASAGVAELRKVLAAEKQAAAPKLPSRRRCMTDMELTAAVALDFLFKQETEARTCDPVLKLRDRRAERLMTRMHDEIMEKFSANFEKYQKAHEGRFARWYGHLWERALEVHRRRAQQRYLKSLWLAPGVCANMRKELEILLNSGWHYLNAKISFETEQKRPSARMCKPGG